MTRVESSPDPLRLLASERLLPVDEGNTSDHHMSL